MSSIYLKTGEKAVILKKPVVRSLYYYAEFYKRYTGLLGWYEIDFFCEF